MIVRLGSWRLDFVLEPPSRFMVGFDFSCFPDSALCAGPVTLLVDRPWTAEALARQTATMEALKRCLHERQAACADCPMHDISQRIAEIHNLGRRP